ncbi:DUF2914 domain-containing protein [Candidatus Parcubacteria bacterium]|nr:DUF2914 domain-containing protein [Candidatus Parcubacteria bacterium]
MGRLIVRSKQLIEQYERHISSGALIAGFILDSLTLRRVDFLAENLVIITYLLIAGLGITILNVYEGGKLRGPVFEWLHRYLPFTIQFAFGGLFSSYLVFYFRSASFAASWPFVLLLAGLLIGNELFKKYYQRTAFQISVLYFCIFTFLIFSVPIILRAMGDGIFLISGVASLIVMALFIFGLARIIPERMKISGPFILWSVGVMYVLMNILYFTNSIPPIPLSLKNIEVYHHLERIQGGYTVQIEKNKGSFFSLYDTVHITSGKPLYVLSSVFAPTSLNTHIVHHWEYFDEARGKWITSARSEFSIVGGRDGGYRGYSWKSHFTSGLWRVSVETVRGQLLGRKTFNVITVGNPPVLETATRI